MMTQKDKEEVARAAEMWRLNAERNKRLAEEAEKERKRKALEWLEAIR
jgi:hypothetical protein